MAWVGSTMVVRRGEWIFVGLAMGLAALGCSRVNPSFGDDDGQQASSGPSPMDTGGTSSVPPTAPADGTTSGQTGTSDGAEGPVTTDVLGSTGSVDTDDPPNSTESTGSPPVECMLPVPTPIDITITSEVGGLVPLPGDCSLLMQRPNGIIYMAGDSIVHQICASCDCVQGPGLTLDFTGTLVPPALPDCGKLVAWAGHAPDGSCRWEGFAVIGQLETAIPHYVAANSRSLPDEPFGPVVVSLAEDEPCKDAFGCQWTPGSYGLAFLDGGPVFMGTSSVVTIGFAAAVEFLVTNNMALVDPECGEHVAWTAQVQI